MCMHIHLFMVYARTCVYYLLFLYSFVRLFGLPFYSPTHRRVHRSFTYADARVQIQWMKAHTHTHTHIHTHTHTHTCIFCQRLFAVADDTERNTWGAALLRCRKAKLQVMM